ncbi:hypothetical protein Ancab_030078 [Ancistrocladus abbreviatus]
MPYMQCHVEMLSPKVVLSSLCSSHFPIFVSQCKSETNFATLLESVTDHTQIKMNTKNPSMADNAREEELVVNANDDRSGSFRLTETVVAFCRKRWRKGKITGVLTNSRYLVVIDGLGKAIEVGARNLRIYREMDDDGSCVPSIEEPWQEKSCQTENKSGGLKLKIKLGKEETDAMFCSGTVVEVRSNEDGYQGSWFTAIIVSFLGVGKFLVEYQTLQTDCRTQLLKEVVNEQDIRPYPPEIHQIARYKLFQEVDAWCNEGWWVGMILEVLDDLKYTVFFASTNEQLECQHSYLRPHQDWVDGKWTVAGQKSAMELKFSGQEALKQIFRNGTMVEVRRIEAGCLESWYTATMTDSPVEDKFLVEYLTLKTNEDQPLREKVSAWNVRPCPPGVLVVDPYKRLQEVDAWYSGGWWVGLISEVLDSKRYIVTICDTGEKLECEQFNLRPHQDWISGKWVISERRPPDLMSRTASITKKSPGRRPKTNFRQGTIVEVRTDEEGYEGSWYTAVILGSKRKGRHLVEYKTLKTDDERDFLREVADARYIRPYPPQIKMVDRYELLEIVDAWYNEGWWTGVISQVLGGLKYLVYFKTSREVMEFDHSNLRSHQEWIRGKWIVSGKVWLLVLDVLPSVVFECDNTGAILAPSIILGISIPKM